jgi:apolipoprotein N-acyltransferase
MDGWIVEPTRRQRNTVADTAIRTARRSSRPATGQSNRFRFRVKKHSAAAMLGGVALWMAFPPVGLAVLAWVATLPWIWLAARADRETSYATLYLAGLAHWLLMTQWVRLPHWSTAFGWLALAAYLAAYVPLFIGLTRVGVHQLRFNVVWVAPIVWTGLEVIRSFFLTGFGLALLGHSQVSWIELIQIADLGGAYLVGSVMILVSSCVVQVVSVWPQRKRNCLWPAFLAVSVLAACWTYGRLRVTSDRPHTVSAPSARIGLIQGTIDTRFGDQAASPEEMFTDYLRISRELVARDSEIDVIVWPESMFTVPLIRETPPLSAPPGSGLSDDEYTEAIANSKRGLADAAKVVSSLLQVPFLVGTEAIHLQGSEQQRFNVCLLFDKQGELRGRYDKMHPVMFGEYLPLGEWLPWLYALTPLHGGLTAGTAPQAFDVAGLRLSTCICFENTVPHLIRSGVQRLIAEGTPPDALVALTNDGWFWGSSLLDLHLTCGVFRAVENRVPMLIAANTGFSAWIDRLGRIRARAPRRQEGIVVAELSHRPPESLYLRIGDAFGFSCVAASALLAVVGTGRHGLFRSAQGR